MGFMVVNYHNGKSEWISICKLVGSGPGFEWGCREGSGWTAFCMPRKESDRGPYAATRHTA